MVPEVLYEGADHEIGDLKDLQPRVRTLRLGSDLWNKDNISKPKKKNKETKKQNSETSNKEAKKQNNETSKPANKQTDKRTKKQRSKNKETMLDRQTNKEKGEINTNKQRNREKEKQISKKCPF